MTGTAVSLGIEVALDYHFPAATDVLLALEVAQLPDQRLIEDRLTVDGSGPLRPITGGDGVGRRTWLRAEGAFRAHYRAIVEVIRAETDLVPLAAVPLPDLPAEVVPYMWPSRYCEADRFEGFVSREFAGLEGGKRILAMAEWIHDQLEYRPGSSDSRTTAADTFVARCGVCRDYAHLLATFARASGVPARLVSAYGWQVEPPDFHAVVEVWLDGGWRLIDPSRLAPLDGIVRICVGRDATDIAFMTSFGFADIRTQAVSVRRLDR
ncbi:transglutaminase family protein [Sphingosinicella sp. CPCC 101087]|uniref:transglutaminase-like domain-containing protein n=1 Tax=Sphingosinicella sp. CPCC 101087 TaxID=2497754 RepID=UPI00197D88CC|nr:transglutaminase family protein [Sphingosinicella sp. CPCC 101087]